MKKTFVLDTSVLLHDPMAMYSFQDNDVIIPLAVIEEVDGQKRREDQVGRHARRVSAELDALRARGQLNRGVMLEQGGTLRVELNHQGWEALPLGLDRNKTDNRILAVALALSRQEGVPQPVILVSKDINMRVKADAIGIQAQDYRTNKVDIEELYTGYRRLPVPPALIDRFYAEGELPLDLLPEAEPPLAFFPHQFLALEDENGTGKSALGRVEAQRQKLLPLRFGQVDLWGIKARNREQRFALELLLNDEIRLVTLVGRAGTGKTLLALAAGLYKVTEENTYRKLLVSRPVIPLGRDLGFLPGDVEEKLRPWMQPLYDNLELIFSGREKGGKLEHVVQGLKDLNVLEIEALSYIRGRSIPGQYFILDEAQNLSPHEIKTVITRVGEGTKIVLTGDPYQIDHPYLDSSSNGLTYLVERLKEEPLTGHVMLVKGERSAVAEMAARLL
ncbi:MAG: PhoH family protein [Bacillota bacterium]|nr:PhoH family protein [Bacillota bacterium]